MGHHKDNDELRDEHESQEAHRQHERDEAFADGEGEVFDEGSQDERRKEGDERG